MRSTAFRILAAALAAVVAGHTLAQSPAPQGPPPDHYRNIKRRGVCARV